MLFNPYSGRPRDPRDIRSDPEGILIMDPDEVWYSAPKREPHPWRTIDSAPKDGTPFLAFNSFKRTIVDASVKVLEDGESWKVGDWIFFADIAPELIPTHWMPRPPLPGAKP